MVIRVWAGGLLIDHRRAGCDDRLWGGAIHRPHYETAGVQHVLGLEMFLGPLGVLIELDPEEISNFAEHAIGYLAQQLGLWMRDPNRGFQWNGDVQLQARPRERNVFQVRNALFRSTAFIFPAEAHHVSTQQAGLIAPVNHTVVYRRPQYKALVAKALRKMPYRQSKAYAYLRTIREYHFSSPGTVRYSQA